MKRVEVYNNDTCRWEEYLIGDWSRPLKVKRVKPVQKRTRRRKTVVVPRDIDEVILEFHCTSEVKYICF